MQLPSLIPKDNAPRTPIDGLKVRELTRLEDALNFALG